MKKIISLFLVFAMVFAVVACTPTSTTVTTETTVTTGTTGTTGTTNSTGTTSTTGTVTPPAPEGFNEDKVVLAFAAISDIHIETSGSDAKFRKALQTINSYVSGRNIALDSIVIAGDICQTTSQISTFKTIYEQYANDTKLFFTLGNHDQESHYQGESLSLTSFKNVLGDKYFTENDNLSTGDRYMSITDKNGKAHHFLIIQPKSYGNTTDGDKVSFHDSSIAWLDAKLAEITAADPEAYVYVFTHAMIADTCYGSDLDVDALYGNKGNGSYWYTGDLTSTLEKYPQVVTFSGHLHFPINDERSIMQNKFTSIGTGSVANLAMEEGYQNAAGTRPDGYASVSSGHVVEVDANGNVRITRLNLATGENFGTPWTLDTPKEDGSHLTKYSKDRANTNTAPSMAGITPTISLVKVGSNIIAALSFDVATDDNFVHHYIINVQNAKSNAVLIRGKWLTDFYLIANPENRAKTFQLSLGRVLADKTYKFEITAVDSWGAKSETITGSFTVSDTFDGTLPEALVDIDFNADGTATDTKGTASVTLNGATIGTQNVKFNGVTKPMVGISSTKSGDSGTLTFNGYSANDMEALYNGAMGFSFEVFYVNKSKSTSTQGIFCSTEVGGLGIAETGGGKPGLCVYATGNKSYHYTSATQVASTTELTHVVSTAIVYGGNIYTTLYVNGSAVSQNTILGKLYLTSTEYKNFVNQISICNDIGGTGFPTTSCTVVDIKVYDQCLNAAQVQTAYNNAAALFAN
jgi:hypothetical protein